MAKHMEELVAAYHPGLRRFIGGASRTALEYPLATQDGLQYIVHTLSRRGALTDVSSDEVAGNMKAFGRTVPPELVAQQTMSGPWAPAWVADMVDGRALPFEAMHRYEKFWRRAYMGHNYGLASSDAHPGRIQTMAQWRREAKQPESMRDLVTMDLRYGYNDTNFANTHHGVIFQPGTHAAVQHRNKLLVVTSPAVWKGGFAGSGERRDDITSLQTSIALFNYELPAPTWEIYVAGERVTELPFAAKQGQRITIRDGVTYLGVIPLPATDLGRTDEVLLRRGNPQQHWYDRGAKGEHPVFEAALVIDSYNFRRDEPLRESDDWDAVEAAYGGFVVELGDANEYGSFDAFQRHMRDATVAARWDGGEKVVAVTYASGDDTLKAAVSTTRGKGEDPFVSRSVNGRDPYPTGLMRDTTLTQQGAGRVEKNGATVTAEPERQVFLQTEPVSGTYAGWNPLPDLTAWEMSVPGDITVRADGRIGLARVVAKPQHKELRIDHCLKPAQEGDASAARAMLLFGFDSQPSIEYNGVAVTGELGTRIIDRRRAYVLPLR
jgi:hypothetical protein